MKTALIVTLLAALPLGIQAQSTSTAPAPALVQAAVDRTHAPQDAEEKALPHYKTAVIDRAQLEHMQADDLASVLQVHFRGELWVHVEYSRNALLLSGSKDAVTTALSIANRLDVPVESEG